MDNDEAAVIQEAAQSINGRIKAFKAQYKTQDDLDIAIMCCLEIMTEHLKNKAHTARQTDTALESLNALEQRLDSSIQLSESWGIPLLLVGLPTVNWESNPLSAVKSPFSIHY